LQQAQKNTMSVGKLNYCRGMMRDETKGRRGVHSFDCIKMNACAFIRGQFKWHSFIHSFIQWGCIDSPFEDTLNATSVVNQWPDIVCLLKDKFNSINVTNFVSIYVDVNLQIIHIYKTAISRARIRRK